MSTSADTALWRGRPEPVGMEGAGCPPCLCLPMHPSPDVRIHCLLQAGDAHPLLADGVPPPGLLSEAEQERCRRFTVLKRRRDWLLGRWAAKHLVRAYFGSTDGVLIPLDAIEILADDDGAPAAYLGGRLPLSLSISHSGFQSFCALCSLDDGHVGADIEQVETRDPAFVRTFFTPAENAAVAACPPARQPELVTALWSAKEAVLKTMHLGLRADTRQVDLRLPDLGSAWGSFATHLDPGLLPQPSHVVTGWVQSTSTHVLSIALLHSA